MTATAVETVTLPMSEQFGPTLQGEGPAAGRPASFIRLGGCNLSCGFCDSAYTWDGAAYNLRDEIRPTDVEEVAAAVRTPLVVITGGEPLLHQQSDGWAALLAALTAAGHEVHVETNGTILPNGISRAGIDLFVISPKFDNAGTHRGSQNPRLHPSWPALARQVNAHLKVVCVTADEVARAATYAENQGWYPGRVWVMPLGATRTALDETWPTVAAAAAQHGLNASHRLHVLAWGDERGR